VRAVWRKAHTNPQRGLTECRDIAMVNVGNKLDKLARLRSQLLTESQTNYRDPSRARQQRMYSEPQGKGRWPVCTQREIFYSLPAPLPLLSATGFERGIKGELEMGP